MNRLLTFFVRFIASATLAVIAFARPCAAQSEVLASAAAAPDGFTAAIGEEHLHVIVCGPAAIHVLAAPGAAVPSAPDQPWLLPREVGCPGAAFQVEQNPQVLALTTSALRVEFSLKRASLQFKDIQGNLLIQEDDRALPRSYEPAVPSGEKSYFVIDRFAPDKSEAFYGLGQHQGGIFNYRGNTIRLAQENSDIAIPLLVSSKGYGLLWNTAAFSYGDNRFEQVLNLEALAGNGLDYFFLYGPDLDQVIHQYRNLTGHVPMLPRWAYGFIQSKDRYESQDQILGIAKRYRDEHIPIDAIVQDWYWWARKGDTLFRPGYPDVAGMLATLHQEHLHTMISSWVDFEEGSNNGKLLLDHHLNIEGTRIYDPTNPAARDFYWDNLAGKLIAQGWDSLWLDSSEPAVPGVSSDAVLQYRSLHMGSGAFYTNIFPLMHTLGVQEHWQQANSDKRVVTLARSAFLGQQRTGAIAWPGDLYSTYLVLKRQIPSALNFALSGAPYWGPDIGGYLLPEGVDSMGSSFQGLYERWFEFGAFCPFFRTHGHRPENEMWTFTKVEPTLIQFDKLRYRLLPYIYSLAWKVTDADYTIQRPLVMDWRTDPKVWNIGDEFMFGPYMLVSPVTEEDITSRQVYLPASPMWYDFWTGTPVIGGRTLNADAPHNRIPIYVRAGSILPLGPEVEYADQEPDGPIELRIYGGADGDFEIYNDEGDNYDYVHGAHSLISLHWDDRQHKLTIGKRMGTYPEMSREIEFHIVMVGPHHGTGEAVTPVADKLIEYRGEPLTISLPHAH